MNKPSLNYCLVTQNLASIVEDTIYDSDRFPDVSDISGEVIFTPNIANGKAYQLVDREGKTYTVPVSRIQAKIINGEIKHEYETGIYLFAAGPGSNPDKITYSVEYRNLRSGDLSFSLSPLKFEAIPGGEVDLTMATPVIGATPAGIVRGPRGTSLEAIVVDNSELVFTAVDDLHSFEIARIPLDKMVRAEADAAVDIVRDALAVDLSASRSARNEAETYSSSSEKAALVATNARDRSISEADLSEDAAAVSVATAIGLGDEFKVRISSLEAMNGVAPETPVDGQTANLIEQPGTLTRAALNGVYPATSMTAVRVPKSLTFEDIQDALDKAKVSGETVVAGGIIDTDQTLIIESDCDFSQLVINYSGAGTAVRVGTTEGVTWRLSARLPHVRHTGKTSLGWGQVTGTVGIELVNLNSCPEILVPRVSRFEIGLAEIGTNGRGHAYNTITIGHLENNKRNQVMMSAGSGWCNENLHLGGRFSHESTEGESVPGVKHLELESADSNQINNNVWIKPSLEGVGVEWALDCSGTYNRIIAGRWERTGGARIRWGNNASYNVIEGGYHADRILVTSGSGATRNEINSPNRHEFFGTSTSRGIGVFLNTYSSTSPAWEILNPSQQDQWNWRATATSIQGRRTSDAQPRLLLDSERGRIFIGNGVSEPSVGFTPVGNSVLRVTGNVNFDNEIRLKSPDGSSWKVLVGDDGVISTQKL